MDIPINEIKTLILRERLKFLRMTVEYISRDDAFPVTILTDL